MVLMPRKPRPRRKVSVRQSTSPRLRRVSAHHTPMAMVKLEKISTRVFRVPQTTFNWCEPATKAG